MLKYFNDIQIDSQKSKICQQSLDTILSTKFFIEITSFDLLYHHECTKYPLIFTNKSYLIHSPAFLVMLLTLLAL